MPNIDFKFGSTEVSCGLGKVDRKKLYGWVDSEVVDPETKEVCQSALLAADGQTLIGSGGTSFGYVGPDGRWLDKSDLKPVNLNGEELKPVSSTLKAQVELKETATVEEFLEHNIRMVYLLQNEDFPQDLLDELGKGTIFQFPFSYRGGLDPDTAFVLSNELGAWMLVGKATGVNLIGPDQQGAAVVEEEEEESSDGDLDFGMM